MNIVQVEYSIATKSLDIFVSGCLEPYCVGCCNIELVDFNKGMQWARYVDKIRNYLIDYNILIDNIFLVGGSFNHQDIEELKKFFNMFVIYPEVFRGKKIWLFAREELKDIQDIFKENCDYIKCGAYLKNLSTNNNTQYGVKLATSNQKIYIKEVDF